MKKSQTIIAYVIGFLFILSIVVQIIFYKNAYDLLDITATILWFIVLIFSTKILKQQTKLRKLIKMNDDMLEEITKTLNNNNNKL